MIENQSARESAQRQTLELASLEDFSPERVAERLGEPVELVRSWVCLGLVQLGEEYAQDDWGAESNIEG
jgi:DNA-directed RNA polymerase specialized sigma24 family protein